MAFIVVAILLSMFVPSQSRADDYKPLPVDQQLKALADMAKTAPPPSPEIQKRFDALTDKVKRQTTPPVKGAPPDPVPPEPPQ